MSTGKDQHQLPRFIVCPQCSKRYDDLHHRRVIDSCGHPRCFSCLCRNTSCPYCDRIQKYNLLQHIPAHNQGSCHPTISQPVPMVHHRRYVRDRQTQSCILEETSEPWRLTLVGECIAEASNEDLLNDVSRPIAEDFVSDPRKKAFPTVIKSGYDDDETFIPLKYLSTKVNTPTEEIAEQGHLNPSPVFGSLPPEEQEMLSKIVQEKAYDLRMRRQQMRTSIHTTESGHSNFQRKTSREDDVNHASAKQERTVKGTDERIRETIAIQSRNHVGNENYEVNKYHNYDDLQSPSRPQILSNPYRFSRPVSAFPRVPFTEAVAITDLSEAAFGSATSYSNHLYEVPISHHVAFSGGEGVNSNNEVVYAKVHKQGDKIVCVSESKDSNLIKDTIDQGQFRRRQVNERGAGKTQSLLIGVNRPPHRRTLSDVENQNCELNRELFRGIGMNDNDYIFEPYQQGSSFIEQGQHRSSVHDYHEIAEGGSNSVARGRSRTLSSNSSNTELVAKRRNSRFGITLGKNVEELQPSSNVIHVKASKCSKTKKDRKSGYQSDGAVTSSKKKGKDIEVLWSDTEITTKEKLPDEKNVETFPVHLSSQKSPAKSRGFSLFGKWRLSWKRSSKKQEEQKVQEVGQSGKGESLDEQKANENEEMRNSRNEANILGKGKKNKEAKKKRIKKDERGYATDSEASKLLKRKKKSQRSSFISFGRKKRDSRINDGTNDVSVLRTKVDDHKPEVTGREEAVNGIKLDVKGGKSIVLPVYENGCEATVSSNKSRKQGKTPRASGFLSDSNVYSRGKYISSDSSESESPQLKRVSQFTSGTDSSMSDHDVKVDTTGMTPSKMEIEVTQTLGAAHPKCDCRLLSVPSIDFASKMPMSNPSSKFQRTWILERINKAMCSSPRGGLYYQGIAVIGCSGSGKSSLLQDIVWPGSWDYREFPVSHDDETLRLSLSRSVCGYHFCQNGDDETLSVLGFLKSFVSMLLVSKEFEGYSQALAQNKEAIGLLLNQETYTPPDRILKECITDILKEVYGIRNENKSVLFVVDANEHRCVECSASHCVILFLANYLVAFPSWFKFLIAGSPNSLQHIRDRGRFYEIQIDDLTCWDVQKDLHSCAELACKASEPISEHLTETNKRKTLEEIVQQSQGSISFILMALAFLESQLSNSQTLPVEMPRSHVDLLVAFVTLKREVVPQVQRETITVCTLEVMLASASPLNDAELLAVLECCNDFSTTRAEFLLCLSDLLSSQILVKTRSDKYILSDFSRQLLKATLKFGMLHINERNGHNILSLYLMKSLDREDTSKMLQLATHITHSRSGEDIADLEEKMAFKAWMFAHVYRSPTPAFVHVDNILCPNIAVYHLLLHTGLVIEDVVRCLGKHPIIYACSLDQSKIVKLLLDHCLANADDTENAGIEAVLCNSIDSLSVLLEHGIDVLRINDDGQSVLVAAYEAKKTTALTLIFDHLWPADIEPLKSDTALSTLCQGCQNGEEDIVDLMLARKALYHINSCDKVGRSPLICAVESGKLNIVKALIANGADIRSRDSQGITPGFAAISKGSLEILEWLVSIGVKIDEVNADGMTLLMSAVVKGSDKVVRFLLSQDALQQEVDREGKKAMILASSQGHAKVVQLLLEHGVNTEAADQSLETPLHHSCAHGHLEVVKILLDYKAQTEARDARGIRPLEHALENKHFSCALLLLEIGARVGKYCWELADRNIGALETLIRYMRNKSRTLLQDEQIDEAKSIAQRALSKCRNSIFREREETKTLRVDLHLLMAEAERAAKNDFEAVRQASKALAINPRSPDAFIARAKGKKALGKKYEALEDLREAERLSPCNEEIDVMITAFSATENPKKRPKSSAV